MISLAQTAILLAAAEGLRKERDLDQPFGNKQNADAAYAWLKHAQRLQAGPGDVRLPLNLALAASSKTEPDKQEVARQAPQLVKQLDELGAVNAYLVLLLDASTRDAKSRGAAIDSYKLAVAKAQDLLRNDPSDGALAGHV